MLHAPCFMLHAPMSMSMSTMHVFNMCMHMCMHMSMSMYPRAKSRWLSSSFIVHPGGAGQAWPEGHVSSKALYSVNVGCSCQSRAKIERSQCVLSARQSWHLGFLCVLLFFSPRPCVTVSVSQSNRLKLKYLRRTL